MATAEDVSEHYEQISDDYEGIPLLSDQKSHEHRLKVIMEVMKIDPDQDQVVDLGAGTGAMALIWHRCHPHAKKMMCVEPSSLLSLHADFQSFFMDAEQFSKKEDIKYDALFMVQAFHNIAAASDPVQLLKNIKNQLSNGGRLCIATRTDCSDHYPWFRSSHEAWNNVKLSFIKQCCNQAGFKKVEVHVRSLDHLLAKSEWYSMLRKRFFSHLYLLDNEQIEQGIQELEQGLLKDKKQVEVKDIFNYVVAWK